MSHIHVDFIEKEERNPSNGGAVFHGPIREPGEVAKYTFNVRNFQPTSNHTGGTFYYKYGINSVSSISLSAGLPDELTKTLSDNAPARAISDGSIDTFLDATGYVSFTYAQPVNKELTFTVHIPSGATEPEYCAEDYVMLRYPRANRLDSESPFLIMNFPNRENYSGQRVKFSDIPEDDIVVWKIDNPLPEAFPLAYDNDEGCATIVLDGATASAVSFRPSMQFGEPEIVGTTGNQDIHGLPTPDMLIITVADQLPAAQKLAELHKLYQGLDVAVLVHDQVYNEFSSGSRNAMAYRRLAKMFYDRNPQKFRHLMFLGPAYYDNRCVLGPYVDRLVCYEQDVPSLCTNDITNYATDAYFGMLSDNYKHDNIHMTRTDINVGRVSSINLTQASVYVDKVKDRFENPIPPEVYNHTLLMAGIGDNTKHSRQANEVFEAIRNDANPTMSVSAVYLEQYNPSNENSHYNAISAALNRGAGYMVYIGHGSPKSVDSWGISEVSVTNYRYAPFVMFSSCDQYAFDHLANGLVETMMFTDNGGALGGVAAVRSVYIEQNQMSCIPVSIAYASASPGDTFGDIFRRSRDIALDQYEADPSQFPLKTTTFRNILSYNLAGDPALPIGVPEYTAVVSEVNSQNASQRINVKPMEPAEFKGNITKDGKTATDFNGMVCIEILDGSHTAETNDYKGESYYQPNTVVLDNEILATAYGNVKNGVFTASTVIPVPSFPTGSYRTVISATSDAGNAIGLFKNLSISEFEPDSYDESAFTPPVIKTFYAEKPDFRPGDAVNAITTIHALIDPSPSGLNTMTGNVNTPTGLTIDGISHSTGLQGFMTRRDDGLFELNVTLKELSEGMHSIELCVANNAGHVVRETIDVFASHSNLSPEITVAESPASSVATIDISEIPESGRLLIMDASGNTILSIVNPSFPFRWNLKDSNGKNVVDGLYKVSFLIKSGRDYGSTPAADIIVLR